MRESEREAKQRSDLMRRLGGAEVEWLRDSGSDKDVVMSSRVRLARNLSGLPFGARATGEQRQESLERIRAAMMAAGLTASVTDSPAGGRLAGEGMVWLEVHAADTRLRELLVERQLISRQLASGRDKGKGDAAGTDPRAVAFDPVGERASVMVNEEDHLRIQSLRSGLDLSDALDEADALDDKIEGAVDFAYNPRFGYLTACPTNVGTGIRVSVMLHLPALKVLGEIDKVKRAAGDMSLAVRGFWGEGSDTDGDFFQVSNQTTLGKSERTVLLEFEQEIVPKFVEYERRAREKLVTQRRSAMLDTVYRALGTLTHARRIGVGEAMDLLSKLRLGVMLGLIDHEPGALMGAIHKLMLLVHPSHLDVRSAANAECAEGEDPIPRLAPEQRKPARADLCRRVLADLDIH